jgi:hypothetical protein
MQIHSSYGCALPSITAFTLQGRYSHLHMQHQGSRRESTHVGKHIQQAARKCLAGASGLRRSAAREDRTSEAARTPHNTNTALLQCSGASCLGTCRNPFRGWGAAAVQGWPARNNRPHAPRNSSTLNSGVQQTHVQVRRCVRAAPACKSAVCACAGHPGELLATAAEVAQRCMPVSQLCWVADAPLFGTLLLCAACACLAHCLVCHTTPNQPPATQHCCLQLMA